MKFWWTCAESQVAECPTEICLGWIGPWPCPAWSSAKMLPVHRHQDGPTMPSPSSLPPCPLWVGTSGGWRLDSGTVSWHCIKGLVPRGQRCLANALVKHNQMLGTEFYLCHPVPNPGNKLCNEQPPYLQLSRDMNLEQTLYKQCLQDFPKWEHILLWYCMWSVSYFYWHGPDTSWSCVKWKSRCPTLEQHILYP